MKTKITLILLCMLTAMSWAQNGINYKAVVKDDAGNIIANDLIVVQFTILETSATGASVYQENHTPTTDDNGLIILNIGEGIPIAGAYSTVDWRGDKHFLNVQIDIGGGLVDINTSEFKAVPYALNVTGLEKLSEGGNTGWRLIGRDPDDYANIGNNAVDFSTQVAMPDIGASGSSAFAAGQDNFAIAQNSAAFGNENLASGVSSFVGGFDSSATSDNAFAFGDDANASGMTSTAFGNETLASGSSSLAIGVLTEASGNNAFASGDNTLASGANATTMGVGTIASGDATMAIGAYNENNVNAVFAVGNGTGSGDRKNAFTVLKDGNTGIGINTPLNPFSLLQTTGSSNTARIESLIHPTGKDLLELIVPAGSTSGSQFIEMQNGSTIVAAVNSDGSAKFKSVQFEDNSTQTTAAIGPVAYGFIETAGTTSSGSSNYTPVWSSANSRYEIAITGESYFWKSYTTIVTPASSTIHRYNVSSVGGKLLVYLRNSTGALIQGNFQFVTYK